MPLTLAELEELRDELARARARGVRETMIDGRRVQYATDAKLAAAIANLNRQIGAATRAAPATVSFSTSKGL